MNNIFEITAPDKDNSLYNIIAEKYGWEIGECFFINRPLDSVEIADFLGRDLADEFIAEV